jgi:hypothetical protein
MKPGQNKIGRVESELLDPNAVNPKNPLNPGSDQ